MIEYYLNRQTNNGCMEIPSRDGKYLDKNNCLAEFVTPTDKEIARQNLGISEVLLQINQKIDSKVIERGGIPWDIVPTENSEAAINSGNIYNALLKYALKSELDSRILEIYLNYLCRLKELHNNLENEINQLNLNLREYIDDLRYGSSIIPIEGRVFNLEHEIKSLAQTGKYGTVISNELGNDEFIVVSLKAITLALNKIWNKIDDITGELNQGINMSITPTYFLGKKGATVNILAQSTNFKFESIAFYANGEIIDSAENVASFETTTNIRETTEITCKATILGVDYEESKTIYKREGFYLVSGNFNSNEELLESLDEDSLVFTEGELQGHYNINCVQGGHIVLMLEASLANSLRRVDLNGVEISLNRDSVNFNGERYVIFTSVNSYSEGTYNIYING